MNRNTRVAANVFLLIPLTIVSAAVACTWLIAHGAPMWLRLAFRMACHGIPRRCIELWGVPMPICARCVGLYAGFFTGLLLFRVLPPIQERFLKIVAVAAAIPLAIDGGTQLMLLRESTNPLRLATGIAAGLAFGVWSLAWIEASQHQVFPSS